MTVKGTFTADVYGLLNASYVFCTDRTLTSLSFDTLVLNAPAGYEHTEYDILKGGKIVDEHHFVVASGTTLHAFTCRPTGYASFNAVYTALGDHPDRNLILGITCTDLLPDSLKAEAAAYTEQIAVHTLFA